MSLEKLTDILVKIDERLRNIESTVSATETAVHELQRAIDSPESESAFRVMLLPGIEAFKKSVARQEDLELEGLEMEAAFSHALYMGLVPENREKIRELLAPSQINHLIHILDCHKKINEMATWAEDLKANAIQDLEDRKKAIQRQIEKNILGGRNSVVAKLQEAEARLKLKEDRIDTALQNLKSELDRSRASTAEANNIIKNSKRPSNKIFSIGAKK